MAQRAPRNSRQGVSQPEDNFQFEEYRPASSARYEEERPRRRPAPAPSGRPVRSSGNGGGRRRKKRKSHGGLIAAIIVILAVVAAGAIFLLRNEIFEKPEVVVEEVKPLPAAPQVVRTATIGATGDILLHGPILDRHITMDGTYDFSFCFSNVAKVYQVPDYMIANLEVTLGGPEYGDYIGWPVFNSPDSIVEALKGAGVDMCLTANNHANDTGYNGIMRTQQVLDEYGLDHIGTRESEDDPWVFTTSINGIRLGMLCYTYDTREYSDGALSLNVIPLSDEAVPKVHTFNNLYIDEFYQDLQQQLDYMDMLNVDASIVFMHWGIEYEEFPNEDQQAVAQRMCDMGVDVIIGGHPHVIQKFDTLTSADGHETVILYSMGNELSNQRRALMDPEEPRGYTEDGLVMEVTFQKFNNGNVKIGGVDVIPTWVELDDYGYQIIAMNSEDPFSWGASDPYAAKESYNRVMERLGDEYPAFRSRKNQTEVLAYIE